MSSPSNPRCESPCPGASARQREGYAAEQRALDYLTARGLRPVARNFRVRVGELDLVLAHGRELVVVEVRRRASTAWGGAAASVTARKQKRVRLAAQAFLAAHWAGRPWPPLRFDVVAIEGDELHWIRAAF